MRNRFSTNNHLPCLHRLQEGLRQGLACRCVGNHEEVQHKHQPYPSHQQPVWQGHMCHPLQQQYARLVPNKKWSPTGMSTLIHRLQQISGKYHVRCLRRSRRHCQHWRQKNHQSPLCWWHRWLSRRGRRTGKILWVSRKSLHSLRHGDQCREDQADDKHHQWHQHRDQSKCAAMSHPSACRLVNHGPPKQSSKEEYNQWKCGANARYYTSYKDHVTNEGVRAKTQQAIGLREDRSIVKRRKLRWYDHVTRSSGLAKTILQGTVKGERRQDRQRKRWEDNNREWTGLELPKSQRAVENRQKMEETGCEVICGAPMIPAVKA